MASSWSISIKQQDGQITFTPDVPGATAGQPLGVNSADNVTWNNRTNLEITLKAIQLLLICGLSLGLSNLCLLAVRLVLCPNLPHEDENTCDGDGNNRSLHGGHRYA